MSPEDEATEDGGQGAGKDTESAGVSSQGTTQRLPLSDSLADILEDSRPPSCSADTAVDSRDETGHTSAQDQTTQEQTTPTQDERQASPRSDGEPAETDSEHTRATVTAGSQDGRLHNTDDDAVNSPQLTLRSRRSSVREFRTATELLLREPLKQRERERHRQVGAQFTESVHLTDFREAVYRAGLANVEGIQQALFEMGY